MWFSEERQEYLLQLREAESPVIRALLSNLPCLILLTVLFTNPFKRFNTFSVVCLQRLISCTAESVSSSRHATTSVNLSIDFFAGTEDFT
ncbi:hypothetical protein XENTR_v10008722 [Xenopus tropicalis]|nr:hypothetical protein XENTR_v10008722 [Xenopus tropicalis]